MEIFRDILSIKIFRESRAEREVIRQRGVLALASEQRESDARGLADYRCYASTHEHALYDDLCRRVVRLRDLESVQQEVVVLRTGERNREAALDASEQLQQREKQRLEEVRDQHRQASRIKEKFVEVVQIYSGEAFKAFERQEDREMEEVAELRRERIEWDETHEEAA